MDSTFVLNKKECLMATGSALLSATFHVEASATRWSISRTYSDTQSGRTRFHVAYLGDTCSDFLILENPPSGLVNVGHRLREFPSMPGTEPSITGNLSLMLCQLSHPVWIIVDLT